MALTLFVQWQGQAIPISSWFHWLVIRPAMQVWQYVPLRIGSYTPATLIFIEEKSVLHNATAP